ncbi:CDP-diacylglycerol--glycerol-3-phosphate 3-phosphatidyltransferase [Chlamydia pneumoniae TW-183]|uniref:CDP-diacylglycerol--glycerol-3-phosphate 3-phosphatidyltransferase n=2 Tax=Chlamydia pneumoniae TaxID=83558 RepID=Q9Z7T9_CHLPN|nr:CDP-alcohol phosphatidyltransferase family protein [Chlamydia pneumoniae]AAD18754.1 Glycerol-3-P Phosphatidyltransferase [Chlamydia pneumoniae CWL029]AAF38015.1 CDP-diacylglycerol--glycerol-3-phosphate 3-phosphatidyltransferase protein, putative [Chlamydia pneumoniae AR39]AAP98568.1 CDP-diacylglycerol--glycerol-3-phosphate 3-phosphatidyltransferase [Chlamydia pneumoniae TW-183]ACZ32498.1 CDP-alcohol phosphatidyltransferase family protein [Chlamydia pneumoniae LPCoLN]ETR80525.1 CDP-alcohol p
MRQFCNLLSLSRLWLALYFCQEKLHIRLLAIVGAMLSDVLDGYLARRYKATSRLGSILDPITDKVFVFVCITVLYMEGSLSIAHLFFICARDLFLIIFVCYLSLVKGWKGYDYGSLFWGKIFTVVQFIILLGVTAGGEIPWTGLVPLVALGFLYFLERIMDYKKQFLR